MERSIAEHAQGEDREKSAPGHRDPVHFSAKIGKKLADHINDLVGQWVSQQEM